MFTYSPQYTNILTLTRFTHFTHSLTSLTHAHTLLTALIPHPSFTTSGERYSDSNFWVTETLDEHEQKTVVGVTNMSLSVSCWCLFICLLQSLSLACSHTHIQHTTSCTQNTLQLTSTLTRHTTHGAQNTQRTHRMQHTITHAHTGATEKAMFSVHLSQSSAVPVYATGVCCGLSIVIAHVWCACVTFVHSVVV